MGCMLPQGYRSMPFIFPFLFSTCPGCTVSPTTCWLSFWLSWERADHWTPATASSSRAGARFSLGEMSFPFDFYGCSTRSSFSSIASPRKILKAYCENTFATTLPATLANLQPPFWRSTAVCTFCSARYVDIVRLGTRGFSAVVFFPFPLFSSCPCFFPPFEIVPFLVFFSTPTDVRQSVLCGQHQVWFPGRHGQALQAPCQGTVDEAHSKLYLNHTCVLLDVECVCRARCDERGKGCICGLSCVGLMWGFIWGICEKAAPC